MTSRKIGLGSFFSLRFRFWTSRRAIARALRARVEATDVDPLALDRALTQAAPSSLNELTPRELCEWDRALFNSAG